MNKPLVLAFFFAALLCTTFAEAQYFMRPHMGRRPYPRREYRSDLLPFQPSVNLSFGYGFPNLDKDYLPEYYHAYMGHPSQKGPVSGAIDYQFSRTMSVGLLVTHGTVSAPYYNNSGSAAFTGKLDNWSFMLNLVRYMPVNSRVVSPYIRTAIGLNSWTQQYTDATGAKVNGASVTDLPDLAYQAGIGAKFNLSKNAGLFVEAGYGKYIVHGGLAFKF